METAEYLSEINKEETLIEVNEAMANDAGFNTNNIPDAIGKYPSIKWVIHRKLDTCDFGAETEDKNAETEDIHQKANDTEEISSQYPNAETEDIHQEAKDIDYAFEGLDSGNCKISSQGSNMNSNISTEVAGSRNLNNSRSVKYAEVANNQSISTDDTKENIATPEILNRGVCLK